MLHTTAMSYFAKSVARTGEYRQRSPNEVISRPVIVLIHLFQQEKELNSSAFCPRVIPSAAGHMIVPWDRCSAELRSKISIALLLRGNYKRESLRAYRDEKFRRSIKPVATIK